MGERKVEQVWEYGSMGVWEYGSARSYNQMGKFIVIIDNKKTDAWKRLFF
jgi:hypothetical protein